MPNIVVRIPAGVLDDGARSQLGIALNRVAAEAEQMPDDPKMRFLCWVEIEEIARGNWTCGGNDVTSRFVPVQLMLHVPAGVLDDAARARYAQDAHQAVVSALPHEARKIVSSCIFTEVPDGTWGVNGALWRLEDFAAAAGYRHLRHLSENKSAHLPPA